MPFENLVKFIIFIFSLFNAAFPKACISKINFGEIPRLEHPAIFLYLRQMILFYLIEFDQCIRILLNEMSVRFVQLTVRCNILLSDASA